MSLKASLLGDHPDILHSSTPSETLFGRVRRALYDAWCYVTYSHARYLLDKGKNKDFDVHSASETHPVNTQPSMLLSHFQSIYPSIKDRTSLASQQSKESRGIPRSSAWRLLSVLGKMEWKGIVATFLLLSIELVAKWGNPFLLRAFLIWVQDYNRGQAAMSAGWKWAALITCSGILNAIGHHRAFWTMQLTGYRMRTTLTAAIYAKLMGMSNATISRMTTGLTEIIRSDLTIWIGHVVNLISNDMRRFNYVVSSPYLLIGPLELIVVSIIIARYLGIVPALSGMSLLILFVPFQAMLSHYISKYREKTAEVTDQRINATSEMITGILAVKMLGWEDTLTKRINSIRSEEHSLLKIRTYINAANIELPEMAVRIIPAILFITCRLMGVAFQLPDVFFALSLIMIASSSVSLWFADSVRVMSELYITCKRIDGFLQMPKDASNHPQHTSVTKGRVEVNNGYYGWFDSNHQESRQLDRTSGLVTVQPELVDLHREVPIKQTLSDIHFVIQPGELIGIAGSVGSGKSCVLTALLNEMVNLSSEQSTLKQQSLQTLSDPLGVTISGKVSFCSQTPWIVAGSVRENITFGQSFVPDFYRDVIDACALTIDLEQLPNGDATELGERGINISGGQKARVALARAAYSRADVHLLDDPLSAVDARVGRILFDRCIGSKGLMKNSTRVLITHQLQYLPLCDRVFLMKDGKIEAMGKWEDLLKHDIVTAIQHNEDGVIKLDDAEKINSKRDSTSDIHPSKSEQDENEDRSRNEVHADANGHTIHLTLSHTFIELGEAESGRLVVEESREIGRVSWSVYVTYCRNLGFCCFLFSVSMLVVSSSLFFFAQWWIATWTHADLEDQRDMYWVWILIAVTATSSILSFVGRFAIFILTVRASTRIHRAMLRRVIQAPLKFFHLNPTGRILNRFAKDMGMQDEELQVFIEGFIWAFLELAGGLVLMTVAMPLLVVFIIIISWIFERVRRRYMAASREIQRFDGISRSSVYALLSDSIKGLSTIRAYNREGDFQLQFQEAVDVNGMWRTAYLLTARWIGFSLDIMTVSVVAICLFLSVLLVKQVSPEILGLALTCALWLTGTAQVLVRIMAELENSMTSVERILDYTQLEQEPPKADEGGGHAPEGWPDKGDILYDSMTASYRPGLEPVLKDISFCIPGGCSVGIVGRTGSGKSSLLLSLFRLIDINSGSISIDGVDTSQIGIDVLRRQLAVIPQDPVLFGGTVRSNLDPKNEHSDVRIWDALNKVCLDAVIGANGGLDASIIEAGCNFSVGQRQVLCLARALLTDAKILALDEATANVDRGTDTIIQQSLRSLIERSEKTLLIVAHRIDTVMDCDLLLVLENGKLMETGSPQELMKKTDGLFAGMVHAVKKTIRNA